MFPRAEGGTPIVNMLLTRAGKQVLFIAAIFLAGVVGAAVFPVLTDEPPNPSRYSKVVYRAHPLRIAPLGVSDPIVTRKDVLAVLSRVAVGWPKYKSSKVSHALRLWGSVERWGDESLKRHPLVQAMLQQQRDDWTPYLLNTPVFLAKSLDSVPLLARTHYGIKVRQTPIAGGYDGGLVHPDKLLLSLGEAGYPARQPIVLADGLPSKISHLITDSLATFDISQELEFSTVAYCLWLPPTKFWTNRFGETVDFEAIASRLLEKPLGRGSCFGAHVPYALVHMLRANEQYPIVQPSTAARIRARLRDTSQRLQRHQLPSGAWDAQWHQSASDGGDAFEQVSATGHHLEWTAMAPRECRPAQESLDRALAFLVRNIAGTTATTVQGWYYGPYSHAARAVFLWSLESGASVAGTP